MKKEDLCDAIGLLDDDLLHEADHFRAMRPRPHRHLRFLGGGLIAAALLLLFLMIPASPPVQPAPDEPKQLLQITPGSFGASGAEILMADDVKELRSVSPWNEDAQIDALPVYVNPDPFTDDDYGLQDTDRNKMKQMLSAAAERLGLDPDELRFYEDADSGCLYVGSEGVELQVDQALTLTITFEPGITLPDDLHFTYTASYAECLKVSEYLKERYAGVIGMRDPQIAIIGGDRDIDGVQRYANTIYEKGETAAEDLLNQQFRSAVFSCDDEGRLWIIRIHDPDLSQQCGEYPIISMQEAESLLKAGTYLSNVPYAISEEDVIAKGELVYRHDQFDRYFMPYYRFLVDIGEDKGMRCYGAFYVPAVSSEYIETMPHEGDIPQTAG